MAEQQNVYLTVAEAATELGMKTPDGVHKLIQRGKLPAVKLSERGTRVPLAALRAYQDKINGKRPAAPQFKHVIHDVEAQRRKFEQAHGCAPEEWVATWKRDEIEDSAENASILIRAVSLREGRPVADDAELQTEQQVVGLGT